MRPDLKEEDISRHLGATLQQMKHIDILIEEFEKLEDGSVYMQQWVLDPYPVDLEQAIDNPCGTAACIAGKAGLIPRIRDLGFQFLPESEIGFPFTVSPLDFFGEALTSSVFQGTWCMENIHTKAQAVIVLKHFREEMYDMNERLMEEGPSRDRIEGWDTWGTMLWVPSNGICQRILDTFPSTKTFPVSGGLTLVYDQEIEEWLDTRRLDEEWDV